MRIMVSKIVFPATSSRKEEIIIRKVSAVYISSSFRELTGRAEITLPRKVKRSNTNVNFFDNFNVKQVFRPGDPVIINLGYDGELQEEFRGYVASVSADIPIVIKCEDEMWKLKRIPVNYSAASTTLEKLLRAICPGYDIDALEGVPLGDIRLAKTTVGKVLEKLKQDFNLYSYMNGKQLVCGKYYAKNTSKPSVNFRLERNLVDNGLTYRSKEDIIVKIKAISILRDGSKLDFEIGEEGGDRLDLTYYNITVKAELERLAKLDYEKRKQDGFDGSITAFGLPQVMHSWKANLVSTMYPDRNGLYYVEGVEKTFDERGYRQEIKLGDKAV